MQVRRRKLDDAEPAALSGGGTRLCAATREALDPEELIRFVADPDGQIVPDLARRLPGRGVWVKGDKATVAQAVRANVFARSLKRQIKADPGLPDRVEALMEKRVGDALAIANKAGLVTAGFEQVDALVGSGAAVILVQGADAAEGGRERLARKFAAIAEAQGRKAAIISCLSVEQLSLAMGRSNVVHAALIQGGAARRLLDEAERLGRYRSGAAVFGGLNNAENLEA